MGDLPRPPTTLIRAKHVTENALAAATLDVPFLESRRAELKPHRRAQSGAADRTSVHDRVNGRRVSLPLTARNAEIAS